MSCCSYLCCSYQVRRKVAGKHRRRLWLCLHRFLSKSKDVQTWPWEQVSIPLSLRALHMAAVAPSGLLHFGSPAFGCISLLPNTASDGVISQTFGGISHDMYRLEMLPQMEPVYTNIVTLSTHSCMQTTSNTTSASRGPWKMQIQQLLI